MPSKKWYMYHFGRGNSHRHRLPTDVPAYRLHKSSRAARVIIDGRHIYLGKYNSPESWEKYRKLIAEWTGVTLLAV